VRFGKRRELQGAPYNYQVDLYLEVDCQLMCDVHRNTNAGCSAFATCPYSSITQTTLDYINLVFTGANTIYEPEIDTHLHILHIDFNGIYDAETSTSNALTRMRTEYAAGSWHYTDGAGVKPDLHHLLMGKNLGGGIAYVGVLCNSNYGFGLSASLNGNFVSMSNSVVWDMMVVRTVMMHTHRY